MYFWSTVAYVYILGIYAMVVGILIWKRKQSKETPLMIKVSIALYASMTPVATFAFYLNSEELS